MPGADDGYTLTGYGTTYAFVTTQSLSGAWQRVDLVWKSNPEESIVTGITVTDRADSDIHSTTVITHGGIRWDTLSGFQRDFLRSLARLHSTNTEKKGLAILNELSDRYGSKVNHGRIYPNLDTLVESGLIEKSTLDKRTDQYELTDAGRSLFRASRTRSNRGTLSVLDRRYGPQCRVSNRQ